MQQSDGAIITLPFFDLIVIGGGPVGLALARAARGPAGDMRVALVAHERQAAVPAAAAPDARVYALSPGNVAFLRDIRAWQALPADRLTPIHAMRVFGDREGSRIDFDAYQAGVPELAWTVEDGVLQQGLWQVLEAREGVQVFAPADGEALVADAQRVTLRLRDGRQLAASLAAGADGARSFVRSQAGIDANEHEYGQAAVVANFACEKAHANVAFQWFQGGPVLALLPLPGRRVSMIWSLPAPEAGRVMSLGGDALCREVEAASRRELGALGLVTPPKTYPLRRLAARRLIAQRTALLGDAAHVIHPLAGQGLNLGLQDARALAHVLASREPVRDAGDASLLRRYERSRTEPILAMDLMVDGLYRLFGARGGGLAGLRNTGLNLTNALPVLKNILIRQAMG